MTEVKKRPSARFVPPPRPVLPSQPPLAPRVATPAETLRAHKRRPSARYGRVAAIGAVMLAATACGPDAPDLPNVPASSCQREFWDNLPSQNLHLPLAVRISINMGEERRNAVQAAAVFWNTTMHATVFETYMSAPPLEGERECGVVRVVNAPLDEPLGMTHTDDCYARVELRENMSPEELPIAIRHELGHTLNLPHELGKTLMSARISTGEPSEHARCIVASALSIADGDETRMSEFR